MVDLKKTAEKYVWFIITNFGKYVNSVGVGQDSIIISVTQEYVDLLNAGMLKSPDKFFDLYDLWKGNAKQFWLNPVGFKQMVYKLTGDEDFAAGRIAFPAFIDNVPVKLQVTGRFVPLALMETYSEENYPQEWQKPARPFPGGFSIGHINVTAGTFTCVVWDKKTGKRVLLSNKHVFSPIVKGMLPTTRCIGNPNVGDYITQPGPKDIEMQNLGDPNNFVVGKFLRQGPYDPWWTGKENLVDSAIAEIINENDVSNEVYNIGEINGITEPEVGMHVRLMGRTSGYREATIEQTPFWVPLCICSDEYLGGLNPNCCIPTPVLMCAVYGPDVRFMADLFDTSPKTAYPGDSGSIVVSDDNKCVGQLFGGDTMLHKGVCAKASNIEKVLDVSFTKVSPIIQPPLGWKEALIATTVILGAFGLGYFLMEMK